MSLEFFKDHICEELHSAKEYIKLAIEKRSTNPDWAKMLVNMSAEELSHATNFYKMFEEYYTEVTKAYGANVPEYLSEMSDEITDIYTEKASKVKYLHEMYVK